MNGRIARPDSLAMIIHLVTGGSDTTSFQICRLLFRVLSQPGPRDRMRAGPGLWEAAIEEELRLDGAAIGLFRTPNEDTEVNGVLVPKDTQVRVMYASANRDAEAFVSSTVEWQQSYDRSTPPRFAHLESVSTCWTGLSSDSSLATVRRESGPRRGS
jgi:Cytochrome P450